MNKRPTPFSPQVIEAKWYEYWEQHKFFHAQPDKRRHYSIVIPPPNVTGALHLGHALNNVIQDVLIRYHRMQQYNTCWIPGTDHAGIATQSVVEARMRSEQGITRHDLGREGLLKKIWEWKEFYNNRIIEQLKRMGCSCDWDRTAFTMNRRLSQAVRAVFSKLFQEGLIYRGKRLINWCPGCRTALSNDELIHRNKDGFLWEIRYPVIGSDNFVTVATTRPETMLGDTAVAVHSQDERYRKLIGQKCMLPLVNREIPIIADDILADPEKGTGAVKVTPAHDPNDYACGKRNNLPFCNILNEDGTLNDNAGHYEGCNIIEARDAVLQDLERQQLLGNKNKIQHAVAHCYRSNDVVEPYLSNQWFVQMGPLVDLARKAVLDGHVQFFPPKKTDDYLRWLDQTPDWCISRQIWWGHRIPIWYCLQCFPQIEVNSNGEPLYIPENAKAILPASDDPDAKPVECPECKQQQLVQDPDVLDTWFSSQLWPLSTLGWPEETEDLNYYYPTSVLVTARDIIALWVARMVMMGMKFRNSKPFSHVFITPTIQDERGDIMSKSRGNGFDPLKVIAGGTDNIKGKDDLGAIPKNRVEHYPVYGCDALRYGLMSMVSGQAQDSRLKVQRIMRKDKSYDVSVPIFEEGKRFCNKIWQACHGVIFANCQDVEAWREESPHVEDRWLLDRLHHIIQQLDTMLCNYRLGDVCETLYHFFWDDLCSWYLEIAKLRLWGNDGPNSKKYAQITLVNVLDAFLRLLHPIMPYITEELWQSLRPLLAGLNNSQIPQACIIAEWPVATDYPLNPDAVAVVDIAQEITSAINNIRAEQPGIREGQNIPEAILTANTMDTLQKIGVLFPGIKKLAKVKEIKADVNLPKPSHSASRTVQDIKVYVPLAGLIDFAAEKKRMEKELAKIREMIMKLEKKLANANYIAKAPKKIVHKDKERLEQYKQSSQNLQNELTSLLGTPQ